MSCPTITTQTMHDALTHRPITTIYVDGRPSIHVIDQCDAGPISLNLRSTNPFRINATGRLSFDMTVAHWVHVLSRKPIRFVGTYVTSGSPF